MQAKTSEGKWVNETENKTETDETEAWTKTRVTMSRPSHRVRSSRMLMLKAKKIKAMRMPKAKK